jgi:glycosyltransferase 2 family protein
MFARLMPEARSKNFWKLAARLALSAVVLVAIIAVAQLENVLAALARAHGELIALGVVLSLLTRFFAAERTYVITRAIRLPLSRIQTIEAMFIANFWSLVLPGVSAGSVATVYRYSRYGAAMADSVGVLSASRAVELAVFCTLGAAAFAWSSHASDRPIMAALFAIPAIILIVFVVAQRFVGRAAAALAGVFPRSRLARKAVEIGTRAVKAFSSAPKRDFLTAAGFALVQCVLDAASALAFARSLGIHLDWLDALWINVLTYLAILLPISVAGLGVRDAAVIVALTPLGVAKETAIALAVLMFAATLVNALIGGALQLLVKPKSCVALEPTSASVRK